MKTPQLPPMAYETPLDIDILEAYIHKSTVYNRADAKKIKRALRKLALAAKA